MSEKLIIFSIFFSTFFIGMLFFVIFGQVTMRKLRRTPETKEALGVEFVSGWNILNVAATLSVPKRFAEKLSRGQMAFYFPDANTLYKFTTRTDRLIARILFYLVSVSILGLFVLMLLEKLGAVK